MRRTFRADLHVHTCLSPCGEEEMTPRRIVCRAKEVGLDVIAICDHNSTRNVDAVRTAGRDVGLTVLGGIEVASQEEIHVLGLFDREEALREMQKLIDDNLCGENNPELFGPQCVCDEQDAVVGRETKLLIGATRLTVDEVVDSIHRLGGLAVASHVDRESFSLLSQFGAIPATLGVDAVEISSRCSVARARVRFPQIRGYAAVRSSDAHRLEELGTASTTFSGDSPSVTELRKALLGEGGREVKS